MSVVLTGTRNSDESGYFRIGDVILQIPPSSIQTAKSSNNEEMTTLRSAAPFYKKLGRERLDVTVTWQAMVDNSGGSVNFQQWEDLRRIVGFFKVAPFIEVENQHLRQIVLSADPTKQDYDAMAFALRQLRVDTVPDMTDVLQVTLNMSYFNYRPFSKSFSYKGPGQAINSIAFKQYMDNWLANSKVMPSDWKTLPEEELRLSWREYILVPSENTGAFGTSGAGNAQPNVGTNDQSGAIPLASKYKITSEFGNRDLKIGSKNHAGIDVGAPQGTDVPVPNPGVVKFAGWQQGYGNLVVIDHGNTVETKYGHLDSWSVKVGQNVNVGDVLGKVGNTGVSSGAHLHYEITQFGHPVNPRLFVFPSKQLTSPLSEKIEQAALPVQASEGDPGSYVAATFPTVGSDFTLDHTTDSAAFYYKEHNLECAGESLHPAQISVVFVNTMPVLPLQGSVYPTCQHIGSAGSMVNISFLSKGETGGGDPVHPGLTTLTSAITELDEQYHSFRSSWRAASSIHAMQAMFVRNRVLHLLGIRSVLPAMISTDTVPDSAEIVQVDFTSSQYENMYERLESFRVKGLSGTYQETWEKILNSDIIGRNMTDAKRQACRELLKFKSDRDQNRTDVLATFFKEHPEGHKPIPFNFTLSDTMKADITAFLDQRVPGAVYNGAGFVDAGVIKLGAEYPDIAARIKAGQFYWSDVVQLVNDKRMKTAAETLRVAVEEGTAAGSETANPVTNGYSQYFQWLYLNKASFNNALTMLENEDPEIKAVLRDSHSGDGPGTDPKNINHGTYRDMGLPLTSAGDNNNPGSYFVSEQVKMQDELASKVEVMGRKAADAVKQFTVFKPTIQAPNKTSDPELLAKFSEQSLMRAKLPPMSMARAFPGYKLFLMEDDNTGKYYCYDDFYSYNAVLNIEVIRYQDQPDTARILIANASNILTHRLFDNSVWGKVEQRDARGARMSQANSTEGPTVNGDAGPVYTVANETNGGVNLTRGFGSSNKKVPNQYFAMQTGTKIQVRFGFSNDPDNLTPVFSGMVTEIEEGEVMVITAQSYMLELMNNFNPNAEGAPGRTIGGMAWWRGKGDTASVMGVCMDAAGANHFGKYQVHSKTGTLARGFRMGTLDGLWSKMTKPVGRISFWMTALSNSYNRSSENIRINRLFTSSGELKDEAAMTRPWNYETPTYLPMDGVAYTFPKELENISPWQAMRDVARRYPENILCVKQFGYPFQADASLVFAHPNDWYIARPAMTQEAELGRFSHTDRKTFYDWWNSSGRRSAMATFTKACEIYQFSDANRDEFIRRVDEGGLDGLNSVMDDLSTMLALLQGHTTPDGTLSYTASALWSQLKSTTIFGVDILGGKERAEGYKEIAQLLLQFQGNYEFMMQNKRRSEPGAPHVTSDRFQPVRTWHMVTSEFIIHNGIALNEDIRNAVKIKDKVYPASGNIPNDLLKVLDVTSLIIEPDKNCSDTYINQAYAQSFLKEEVGQMYRGELILIGTPEIEPFDVILLADSHRGIYGPIEVDSVIHEFSEEHGFITIVKPRALILVNEVMGAGITHALGEFIGGGAWSELKSTWNHVQGLEGTSAAVAGTGVAVAGAQAQMLRAGSRMVAGAAARGVGSAAASVAGAATGAGAIGGAATAAAAGAVEGGAAAAGTFIAAPPAWVPLLMAAGYGTYKSFIWAVRRQEMNPLFLVPLTQFERPWVAGINGWDLEDLSGIAFNKFNRMVDVEVRSTIEGFKEAYHLNENYS